MKSSYSSLFVATLVAGSSLISFTASGALLKPDELGGLQLWLEARSDVDTTSDDKVTQWGNLGGAINAVAAGGEEPTYLSSGGSNGTQTLSFGAGQRLVAGGIQNTTVSAMTAFAVVSMKHRTGNQAILDDKSLTSGNPGFYLALRGNNLEFRVIDKELYPTASFFNHSLALPTEYDGEFIVLMARINSSGTTTLRIGDANETTISRSHTLTDIKGTSPFTIGSGSNGSWAFAGNQISSVVVYNQALSDSDAEGVYNYLYTTQVAIPEAQTVGLLGMGMFALGMFRKAIRH